MKICIILSLLVFVTANAKYTRKDADKDLKKFLRHKKPKESFIKKCQLFKPENVRIYGEKIFKKSSTSQLVQLLQVAFDTRDLLDAKKHRVEKARAFMRSVGDKELKHLNGKKCFLLVPMAPYSHLEKYADNCATEFIKAIPKASSSLTKDFPRTIFQKDGEKVIKKLGEKLHLLNPSQLKMLFNNVENCSYIDAKSLAEMNSNQAKLFTDKCFSLIRRNIRRVDMGKAIRRYSPTIFRLAQQRELHDSFFQGITKEQLQSYGVGLKEERCFSLKITEIPESLMTFITKECFKGWLQSHPQTPLGTLWRKLNDSVLDGKNIGNIPELVASSDWEHLKPRHLSAILQKKSACSSIPADAQIQAITDLSVTDRCFSRLPPSIQAAILGSSTKLEPSILSLVTASMALDWSWKQLHGLELLNQIRPKQLIPQIIAQMSSKVDDSDHICTAIRSLDQVPTVLHETISASCARNLGFELTADDIKSIPRLLYMQSLDKLRSILTSDDWKTITASILSGMTNNSDFCSKIDKETFALINLDAYVGVADDCVPKLSFGLVQEQIIRFPQAAFSLAEKSILTLTPNLVSLLTDDQLEELSSKVTKSSNHVFAVADEALLSSMRPERIGRFKQHHFNALPLAAFRGIKTITFLRPEELVYLSHSQVRQIPTDALLGINAAQAEKIGIMAKEDPAPAFKPILDRLNADAKAVLQRRLGNSSELGMKFASIAGLVIAALTIYI